MPLNKILLISKELSIWLHQHTNEAVFNNVAEREILAICLWQQALDVEDGIRVLLENNLPGAALALARPLLECYVRGIWLSNAATDEEIEKFLDGKCNPKISKLAEIIGNDLETGGAWINATIDAHIKVMHDLTHGGTSHISPRCSSDAIEPHYSEAQLISLAILGIDVKIRIGAELLAKLQKEKAIISLTEKAEHIRNLFPSIYSDVSK